MRFFILLKYVFKDLMAQKKRSFLAMLGIIIGVAAVIAIMAVGASAQDLILSQVTKMGANLVSVLPGASDEKGPPASALGIEVTTLTYEDALSLKDISQLTAVCSLVSGRGTVSYFGQAKDFDYTGVTPECLEVENAAVASGRFINQDEVNSLDRVAVLGFKVKKHFFGTDNPIGKRVKIGQINFRIIGVMEERGVVAFQDKDNQIYIPVKTAQKMILGINHLHSIAAKVDTEENVEMAMSRIKDVLRFKHHIKEIGKEDFSVRSTAQALDILSTVTQAIKMFLAAVAAISLLVGGIGIMNIMFVVVNERTREIGLRKALGARRRNIMTQFLMESAIMTLLGGMMGICLGVLIALAVSFGVNWFGYDWKFIVTISSVFVSVFMAISVGLVFGLWPANRASKLDPIEALRYE